jgi:hypothetical protein
VPKATYHGVRGYPYAKCVDTQEITNDPVPTRSVLASAVTDNHKPLGSPYLAPSGDVLLSGRRLEAGQALMQEGAQHRIHKASEP